jgi:chromosome segregation ATPase
VIEERDIVSTVTLSSADDQTIRIFLQSPITSEKVKKALDQVVQMKHKLAQLQQELNQVQSELKILVEDQARLRANMQALPQSSETYKRYLKKLDEQEPKIEQYQDRIKALQQDILKQRQSLENYLAGLNLD